MASIRKSQIVAFCSFLWVGLSAFATSSLYARLIQEQRPAGAFSGLPFGKHAYLALSHDRCVGWTRYELEYDGSYGFISEGKLQYALGPKEDTFHFRGGMAFNSLNQMSGFYLRLSHSDYKLLIQGEKVNPIQISVAGDVTGLPIQIARQLPGPVEMFIQPDGGASLRYRILPNFEGRIGSLVQRGALIDSMQLSTKEVDGFEEEDLQQACEDHGKGIARLDDAYAAFMSTVQRLRGAIP